MFTLKRFATVILLVFISSLFSHPAASPNRGKNQRLFEKWITVNLWPDANRMGISRSVFMRTLAETQLQWNLPDLVVPGIKQAKVPSQNQAEFRSASVYFSENTLRRQAKTGRRLYQKWGKTLERIKRKYGVPGRFLIAVWGRESAFGTAGIPHSAIRVLATKAFMSTRKKLFRQELLHALIMIEQGHVDMRKLKGSWAGALGQPQFMPSSFLKYAVDFDGDGRKDIWNSVPDVLASIANYLRQNGWVEKLDWGFETRIPVNVSCVLEGPDYVRSFSHWHEKGVRRVSGRPFPASIINQKAMILMPEGRRGLHFLVTTNFYVIKKYNNSDLYALYVGNLADRIAYDSGSFKTIWPPKTGLSKAQVMRIQGALAGMGHDVGGVDGLVGYKTRRSIGRWQTGAGHKATCFPDRHLAKKLQQY